MKGRMSTLKSVPHLLVLAALLLGTSAWADPYTIVNTFTGTGSLDGVAFTNALVTITSTGDTVDNSNPFPGVYAFGLDYTTIISVAGAGSDILEPSSTVDLFDNQDTDEFDVGLIDVADTDVYNLIQMYNSTFGTFDLSTTLGPISTTTAATLDTTHQFPTTNGTFYLTSADVNSPTFDEFPTPPPITPEPGTFALLGTGLFCIAALIRKRSRIDP